MRHERFWPDDICHAHLCSLPQGRFGASGRDPQMHETLLKRPAWQFLRCEA